MKIILDLDTGIDDALAILYCVGKDAKSLHGITTVFGNASVDNTTQNSLDLLNLLGCKNVEVYKGASHNKIDKLYEQRLGGKVFHGTNGIAELSLPQSNKQAKNSAVDFIIESAKNFKEELKIVATGPLTNIADVIDKDKNALKNVDIIIMGGALTVRGNIKPLFAEANFFQDPISAHKVLNSGLNITLIGLDVTLRSLLTRKDVQKLKENINNKEKLEFWSNMLDFYFKAHEKIVPHLGGCALHDPLAVAVAFNKNIVKTFPFALEVVTNKSEQEYGRLLNNINGYNVSQRVNVALDVDESFKKDFLDTIFKVLL